MKKWIISVIFLLVCIVSWQAVSVYKETLRGKTAEENDAAEKARERYQLRDITNVQTYFGEETFYIVEGTNKQEEEIIVWVSKDDKKRDMIAKKAKSGVSRDKVIQAVKEERNPREIKSVRLGMQNSLPLWEVTYIDEENRFTYYYMDFESGQFLKRYSLSQP